MLGGFSMSQLRIEKIQELRNASLEPVQEPVSAEERIASALEYQILSSMPDNEE